MRHRYSLLNVLSQCTTREWKNCEADSVRLTVPHRLFEAGFEVGHALDVLAARVLVGGHHRSNLLQQLLLGAGVTWQVENSPQHTVGGLRNVNREGEREGKKGEMSLSEAATRAFLSGVLKGAEECLGFLKGSSLESTPHEYPPTPSSTPLKKCNCSTCLFQQLYTVYSLHSLQSLTIS